MHDEVVVTPKKPSNRAGIFVRSYHKKHVCHQPNFCVSLRAFVANSASLLFVSARDTLGRRQQNPSTRVSSYLDKHPATSIVVIDTWQKVKGSPVSGKNAYESDYDLATPLHRLAAERDILLILVHHTKKAAAVDVLDDLSGSRGLTGVVDTILVLRRSRGEADATLFVTGRDVDEAEFALRFNDNGTWTFLGLADQVTTNKIYSMISTSLAIEEPVHL
jgi:hypothetical protein